MSMYGPGNAGNTETLGFTFDFDTANLATGAAFYTPTAGDILIDAWLQIGQAWNGTTPQFDFGPFAGFPDGFFRLAGEHGGVDLTGSDRTSQDLATQRTGLPSLLGLNNIWNYGSDLADLKRFVPALIYQSHVWKLVVSQDGSNTGAAPGSTQGAATLYLVIAHAPVITSIS
jgi:hypothetical protein